MSNTYTKENFRPTWLYIKRHKLTGLKYFGKFIQSKRYNKVESYPGSGKYWSSHYKLHGKEYIETIWSMYFTNIEELTEFALAFSELFDIVESDDWANLKPENGLDGGCGNHSEETRKLQSIVSLGKKKTQEHCDNIAKGKTGKSLTKEHIKNRKDGQSKLYWITWPKDGTNAPDENRTRREKVKGLPDFCKVYNLNPSALTKVAKKKLKHYKGFVVEYENQ